MNSKNSKNDCQQIVLYFFSEKDRYIIGIRYTYQPKIIDMPNVPKSYNKNH